MSQFDQLSVTSIPEAFTVNYSKGRTSLITQRRTYALTFCLEGSITYHHNGADYVCRPGVALILPKGASYTITGEVGGYFPVINFRCDEGFFTEEFISLPVADTGGAAEEYGRLCRAVLHNQRFLALSSFYALLERILSGPQRQDRLLQPALEYIEAHFREGEISNETLAKILGISQVYLRRLFSENLGITPRQYVLQRRIAEARRLLVEKALSVTQIAETCGFGSVYDFSRSFKNRVGISPQHYRQTHQDI